MVCVLGNERSPLPILSRSLHCWMAEALSAESMTVTGPSAHAGLYWRSTENAKLWNVPPWTPPMM